MNRKEINLDVFENPVAAVSHFLQEEFPEGYRGWRLTGRRDGAEGTFHGATCGNGFAFSYIKQGQQVHIHYFESELEAIKQRAENSIR